MKRIFFVLLFPIMFTNFAFAENPIQSKVDSCKSISDKDQRLACYDAVFDVKSNVDVTNSNNKGKWLVSDKISPIDDSKSVYLELIADSPISSGYKKSIPSLHIRCKEKQTDFFIDFDVFLGSDSITPTTRIDSEKAIKNLIWALSTDHNAMFYNGSSKKVIAFIKSLINKNKLFVQVTPYSESPVNTTFDLTGLDEAIKPLRAACNW